MVDQVLGVWKDVEAVSIRSAALFLNGCDPMDYGSNVSLPSGVGTTLEILRQAILAHQLEPIAAFAWSVRGSDSFDGPAQVPSHLIGPRTDLASETTLRVDDLAVWCESNNISHPFCARLQHDAATGSECFADYPDELRAAVEAFEAIRHDAAAISKHTPKAALRAWLGKHKQEIGKNARERIATVANWQPQGGAPKTPG
jgi:hypothetical protein